MVQLLLQVVDDALDSLFHDRNIEIEKQAQPEPAEAQVRQNLGNVNVLDHSHRFGFDENLVLDDQVCAVHNAQRAASVLRVDGGFTRERQLALCKLDRERCCIRRFQQSWTQDAVDRYRSVDNVSRNCLLIHDERDPI